MSVSVSRESISKLMTELVDSFPMEADGRTSISDFGKLLFAEGHAQNGAAPSAAAASGDATAVKNEPGQGNNEENEDDEEENEDEEDETVDDEMTPTPGAATAAGTKRVFTEIKGVPRQKHHDVQCVVTDSGKIAISHGSMNKLMKAKDKAVPKRWTQEEDDRLRQAVAKHGERNWKSIAEEVPGRNHTQCLQRWTKVLAPGLVKGHWRPDEDELLKELVAEGRKNWGQVANRIPGRTSKQCRERWYNHLDPSIVRGEYSAEEDRIIVEAQARLGNKWSTIAAMLPGRTEDAVKIRWKSLCRVRKGQNRRSGNGAGVDKGKAPMGMPGKPGFNGSMVKSEELRAFTPIPTQATPMGRVPIVQAQMMGHPGMQMNGVPTMVAYAPGSYPNAMGGFPKTVMMTPVNSYGQAVGAPMLVPSGDFNVDRRANVVNIAGPQTTASGAQYRQVYATTSAPYSVDANGNMYSHGGVPGGYMNGANGGMYRVPSQPTSMPMSNSMMAGYGYPMGSDGQNFQYGQQGAQAGDQFAAAAQFNQNQASMQASKESSSPAGAVQQEGQPTNDQAASTAQQNAQPNGKPSLAAAFAQSLGTPKGGSSPAAMFAQRLSQTKGGASPATMFAQNLAKTGTPTAGQKPSPAASFMQKQNENSGNSTEPKGFNPAIAFAQRLQKPPIPSSSSSVKSTEDDETMMSEDGDEPSLKKVKPRSSIDMAARASAARRMRASGNGQNLMGRRSLDVFLNEIGDVGRISDLKMDEFQTMDELWRVSGDMDRLSL